MDLFGEPDAPEETPAEEEGVLVEPSADEGLLQPRHSDLCIGHNAHESRLLDLFTAGRMPHGIILTGPKGIGKATFAYRLARFLLKQQTSDPNQDALFDETPSMAESFAVPSEDPVFRKVASGGHPDMIAIERAYDATKDTYKESVAVDEVRKVTPFLRKTASYDGGWRVVIIDDADTMNRNAQNALLKILEEPPANTVLILVCHRLGALIPTIRSRTQTFNFTPLSRDNFETLLERHGYSLSPAQLDTVYHLSDGSLGLALEVIEQGGLDTLAQILGMLESWPKWSWPDIHTLSEQLARSGYKNFTMLMPWIFAQMVNSKARGQNIDSKVLHINAIETMHRQSSLETLLKICENLKSHFERVDRANLDKRQAVLNAFSIITA